MERILSFGEVLWDLLPNGRFLGGAPLNVSYHLAQLGYMASLVSAVGRDELGSAALAQMKATGVDGRYVKRHATLSTGTAEVQLTADGHASFRLPQPVAWDDIRIDTNVVETDLPPTVIVYGTLALRSQTNRIVLTKLLNAFPEAWFVCDLNLRPPFDDLTPLAPLLGRAHVLKLNGDEACRLRGCSTETVDWQEIARQLSGEYGSAHVCITLGREGACLWDGVNLFKAAAPSVTVRDTIGAGDAFTAGLIAGQFRAADCKDWSNALRTACALGAFVASRDGAQPAHEDFQLPF